MNRKIFLANLLRSNLLTFDQFEEIQKRLPETNRAWVIARLLVDWGFITKFQAEMLLGGRTGGFTLGQYRIIDELGRGGMGRVYKAVHQTMNRVVALKVMSNSLMKHPKAQELFLREVRAAGRLVHPNVVTAYDANQTGGRYYLAMELVEGPNLERLVLKKGPLPVGAACDFIRQAALGLQAAHEMGMVHCDIKPANLLVQRVGAEGLAPRCIIKILDFGLARLHSPGREAADRSDTSLETDRNAVVGTPDYISPEQAKSLHATDIRSDLYSLGCTLYFLLTGQVPFPGGGVLEKLVRQGTAEPTPVEQLRPDVPPEVSAIVRRLMAKSPADRFQTPAELASALTPFSDSGQPSWSKEEEKEWSDPLAVLPDFDLDDLAASPADSSALAATIPATKAVTRLADTAEPTRPLRRIWLIPLLLTAGLLIAGILVMLFVFRAG